MDGVFEIEDDGVRSVQSGVDEVLGLVAGKIERETAETIFCGEFGKQDRVGKCETGGSETSALYG